jgi:N utilization substance protein A
MKGSRVQAVIRELHGEKIDIIEWSENPAIFAAHALSPAKVNKVQIIDPATRRIEVIVEDDQQSLAIGKQGQNVRLAARLVGWNIDIRSESDVKREVASQMEQLIQSGAIPITAAEAQLGADAVARLTAHGFVTLEQLTQATIDELGEMLNCSLIQATSLLEIAQTVLASSQPAIEEEMEEAAEGRPPLVAEASPGHTTEGAAGEEAPPDEAETEAIDQTTMEPSQVTQEEETAGETEMLTHPAGPVEADASAPVPEVIEEDAASMKVMAEPEA